MRYTIYILLIVSLSFCQTKQIENPNVILGKGKVYYASDYMKYNDGKLDVEFTLSREGVLISKIDYDTGSKRKPSESRYKFSALNIIERIDQYGDDIHYSSEYFDKIGNLTKYIPSNIRDYRDEEYTDYLYDQNNYQIKEVIKTLKFYKDKIIKSDSVNYSYSYNNDYTIRNCTKSNDSSVYIKEYTFDKHKNILKECGYKKGSKSKYVLKYLYDDKDRMIMKGQGDFQNCIDDELTSFTNHWEYKYNDQNLLTVLKLYLYGKLQYTIEYTYDNLDLLKIKSIPKEMIKFMIKN